MGAGKTDVAVDPYEWEVKLGVYYMKDARGKVIATVRETSAETFIAHYGLTSPETYTELEKARSACSARFVHELEEAEHSRRAAEEKAKKTKEKKDG